MQHNNEHESERTVREQTESAAPVETQTVAAEVTGSVAYHAAEWRADVLALFNQVARGITLPEEAVQRAAEFTMFLIDSKKPTTGIRR